MKRGIARQAARTLAVAGLVVLLGAGAPGPAGARSSPSPVVDIHSAGGLSPDGSRITVQVLASCPERWTVVEAVVTVSQPQASGQASFTFPCIGSIRAFTVVVPSTGGTFELGEAQATASLVIQRGRAAQAQDSEVIDVQPTVSVDIAATARLESGGAALLLDIVVACPIGASGAESYVNVSQGQTTAGNGQYVPICDGQEHTFGVRVEASRGTYEAGSAQALTFAFVEHEEIATAGVDEGAVQIVT